MLSIIAQWIIVTERFGRVSKSRTSRRCRTIHPNVRSTAQRFGRVRNVPKVADRLVYPQALLRASGPPPRDDRFNQRPPGIGEVGGVCAPRSGHRQGLSDHVT